MYWYSTVSTVRYTITHPSCFCRAQVPKPLHGASRYVCHRVSTYASAPFFELCRLATMRAARASPRSRSPRPTSQASASDASLPPSSCRMRVSSQGSARSSLSRSASTRSSLWTRRQLWCYTNHQPLSWSARRVGPSTEAPRLPLSEASSRGDRPTAAALGRTRMS